MIYTHIWQHDDRHFACEGRCTTSYADALQHLHDYYDSWQAHHFHYYGTYVEDPERQLLYKIDLFHDLFKGTRS